MGGDESRGVLQAQAQRADAVRTMFSAIARRYDLLNHLLSLNLDRRWRRRAAARLLDAGRESDTDREPAAGKPGARAGVAENVVYLDACAGTFDLSLALSAARGFEGRVIATDFAVPMLEHGKPKLRGRPVTALGADTLRLPFRDAAFAGAMVAFGVRNLADLDAGLRELARVLRRGAPLVVLEFAIPRRQPLRGLYLLYFRRLLPWIGNAVSRHRSAYRYLPESVLEFPSPDELAQRMRMAGLEDVSWRAHTAGIVAIHVGRRAQ